MSFLRLWISDSLGISTEFVLWRHAHTSNLSSTLSIFFCAFAKDHLAQRRKCASNYYSEKEPKHVVFLVRGIFLRPSEEVSGDLFTSTVRGLTEKDEDESCAPPILLGLIILIFATKMIFYAGFISA
jgi:hypothetical protein